MELPQVSVRLKAEISCSYTCQGCGTRYTWSSVQEGTGRGRNAEAARRFATRRCQASYRRATGTRHCPVCGAVPPDAVAHRRDRWYTVCFFAMVFLLPLPLAVAGMKHASDVQGLVLFRLTPADGVSALALATWLGIAVAGLLFLCLLRVAPRSWDHVALPGTETAGLDRKGVRVSVDARGDGGPVEPGRRGECANGLLLAVLGCGVALFAAAEAVRVACRWPLNPQAIPEVVGPGDRGKLYLRDTIPAVKGLWTGQATAWVVNGQEIGLSQDVLAAGTKQSEWEQELLEQSHHPSFVWVELDLPADPSFARKDLELQIDARLIYPRAKQDLTFENVPQKLSSRTGLRTSTAYAGLIYNLAWWGGQALGVVTFLGSTLALYYLNRRNQNREPPLTVTPLREFRL